MTPPLLPAGSTLHVLEQQSFSDEAAQPILQSVENVSVAYASGIRDVWNGILAGANGLIPFENSSGGVVWPHLDRLLREELAILAEVRLHVNMCVGGMDHDSLQKAVRSYSHPKGHQQCDRFYAEHPQIQEYIDVAATPDGPRRVRDTGDSSAIALASRRAIAAMDLQVLAEDVADLKGAQNVTQFFLVHRNGTTPLPDVDRKHHAAVIILRNRRGVLARTLSMLANAGMDVDSLPNRPIAEKEYAFFVEMTREGSPTEMDILRQQLEHAPDIQKVKWLGSWDARFSV